MRDFFRLALRSACVVAVFCLPAVMQTRESWTPDVAPAAGLTGSVSDGLVADLGLGPSLYVAGDIGTAGLVAANGVARWDGHDWLPVGDSIAGHGRVLALFDDGSGAALYVGGEFANAVSGAVNVARWDGRQWAAVGGGFPFTGPNLGVLALAVGNLDGSRALYAAGRNWGNFGAFLARWDGHVWTVLAQAGLERVNSLAVLPDPAGDWLVAGGEFPYAGGMHRGAARWNGAEWKPLGDAAPTPSSSGTRVRKLELAGAPALFMTTASASGGEVRVLSGSSWQTVGSTLAQMPFDVCVHDDGTGPALHASIPSSSWPTPPPALWRLSGNAWTPVPSPEWGDASTLVSADLGEGPTLFALGSVQVGGNWIGAAAVQGAQCRVVGAQLPKAQVVYDFEIWDDGSGPALVAGGSFGGFLGPTSSAVARRVGETWQPLGGPFEGTVNCFASFDDGTGPGLVAGGFFSSAGGVTTSFIARWNGSTWSPLGPGLDGIVYSLAVFPVGGVPRLFAGGQFLNAGTLAARGIACWDGSSWSPVPGGPFMNSVWGAPVVSAMCVDAGTSPPSLVVGGSFDQAGSAAAINVARWDGVAWTALGSGLPESSWWAVNWDWGIVSALAAFDDGSGPSLVAGGQGFLLPGTAASTGVARWNGASWSSLGSDIPSDVSALAFAGSPPSLYAGGLFSYVSPGAPPGGIARWTGSQWTDLAGGLSGVAFALHPEPGSGALLVGGQFSIAGGVVSNAFARWADDGLRAGVFQPGGAAGSVFAGAWGLIPGRELYQVFSGETLASVGSGPFLGLFSSNPAILVAQASVPLGTAPFHLLAASPSSCLGPYTLPPLTLDTIAIEVLAGQITAVSPVARVMIQ